MKQLIKTWYGVWGAVIISTVLFTVQAQAHEAAVESGLQWLIDSQHPDNGSWGTLPELDTPVVLSAFQKLGETGYAYDEGLSFLEQTRPECIDFLSRKTIALSAAGRDVSESLEKILAAQNEDGGFGFALGYCSSVIDSLIAARALSAAGVEQHEVIGRLVYYITESQSQDNGSFSYAAGGPESLAVTCCAAIVLSDFSPRYDVSEHLRSALHFISGCKNPDGGYGESGSTVIETALAVRALTAAGGSAQDILSGRRYLTAMQNQSSGAWNDAVYETALALRALNNTDTVDRANLQVHPEGITMEPQYPAQGQTVTVTGEVRNTGSSAAENVGVSFYLGDPENGGVHIDSATVSTILAGDSEEVQITFTLTGVVGERDMYVVADPDNSIPEISEHDNTASKGFVSGTMPDIAVVEITRDVDTPAENEPFTISAGVLNLGESDAGPVTVFLYDGDPGQEDPLLKIRLDNVCGGCSGQADFTLQLSAGTHTLYITAYPDDPNVEEQSLSNNRRSYTANIDGAVIQGIDLAVSPADIDFSPPYPRDNETVTITATVRNSGSETVTDASVELFRAGSDGTGVLIGEPFRGVTVPGAGAADIVMHDVSFEAGLFDIYVKTDPDNTYEEHSENNNIAAKQLRVLSSADELDLSVGEMSFDTATPLAGDPVRVSCRITNNSTVPLEGVSFGIYAGDPRSGGALLIPEVQTVSALGIQSSIYIEGTIDTAGRGGEQHIYIMADVDNDIAERNEENNLASAALVVTGESAPDLIATDADIIVEPADPAVGDNMTVTCRITNAGSVAVSDDFQVNVYDGPPSEDNPPFAGLPVTGGMPANGYYLDITLPIPAAQLAGTHTIYVVADDGNAVSEFNEYNNTATKEVTVQAADLSIGSEDISFSLPAPMENELFTLTAVVHNIGMLNVESMRIAVYTGDNDTANLIGEQQAGPIGAGESVSVEVENLAFDAAGSYNLQVKLDPDNLIAEASEDNNEAEKNITIVSAGVCITDADCDDGNVCNGSEICQKGTCTAGVPPDCDDRDNCTTDTCDPVEGCKHELIPGCVVDGIDLVPLIIDTTGVTMDAQAGDVGGTAAIDIENRGTLPADAGFMVTVFDDVNENSDYDNGTDTMLGTAAATQSVASGGTMSVTIALSGTLSGNKVYAAVDTENLIPEINEVNNVTEAEILNKKDSAAACGAEWLVDHQHEKGGWSISKPARGNAASLRALAVTGNMHLPVFDIIKNRVYELQATNGSWDNDVESTCESIMALLAAGEDRKSSVITNAVAWLKRIQRESGSWNNVARTTGMAIAALIDAGENKFSAVVQEAKQWLLNTQNPDGFWGHHPGYDSHVGQLYYPMTGLVLAFSPSSDTEQVAIDNAVAWYTSNYYNRTKLKYSCLNILRYAGVTNGDIVDDLKYDLLDDQYGDGGWGISYPPNAPLSEALSTAESIITLSFFDDTTDSISDGVSWIENNVNNMGDLTYPYEKPYQTAMTLLALNNNKWAKYNQETVKSLERIINTQNDKGTWHGRLIKDQGGSHTPGCIYLLWSLGETHIDIPAKNDAISMARRILISSQLDNGGWCTKISKNRPAEIGLTCYALLALLSSGSKSNDSHIYYGINWLLEQSNSNGSWDSVENTALAAMVLEKAGGYHSEVDDAAAWLLDNQNYDGGWGNPYSTASDTSWTIISLSMTGNEGLALGRGLEWLLSLQNEDCGWASVPGIPASDTTRTALAVWALSVADYSPDVELNISFDKEYYYPGETVGITVAPHNQDADIQSIWGTVSEYNADTHNVSFIKLGNTFIGEHRLSDTHAAGTDVVSVEAVSDNKTGLAVNTFVVKNAPSGFVDLKAGDTITLSDDSPEEGDVLTISTDVYNIGTDNVTDVVVRFLDGAEQIGNDQAVDSLAPGEHAAASVTWHTVGQAGRNYIHVQIDPDNETRDVNRLNNEAITAVDVGSPEMPDLAVSKTDISVSKPDPAEGEEITVSAVIRNRGTAVDGVEVCFYEGEQTPETLISRQIIYENLSFGAQRTLCAAYDTAGRAGLHDIIVTVDPEDLIDEENELNNRAQIGIDVQASGLSVDVAVGPCRYEHDENVLIETVITNSTDAERVVTVDLTVVDSVGTIVSQPVQGSVVTLAASSSVVLDEQVWNTGTNLAGDYTVVAEVYENDIKRVVDSTGIVILADKTVSASVTTDRQFYYDHEQVRIASLIKSFSPNFLFTGLTAAVTLKNSAGEELYKDERDIRILYSLGSRSWDLYWNSALSRPGVYHAGLRLTRDGELIAADNATFSILASVSGGRGLDGSLSVQPQQVYRGMEATLHYSLINTGNIALDRVPVHLKAVLVADQRIEYSFSDNCSLASDTCNETMQMNTLELSCGDHMIILSAEAGGDNQTVAFAPLRVVNRCPAAAAGENRLQHVGDTVQVDGSASVDPDGDSLTYRWELAAKPETSTAVLSQPDSHNPVFQIDLHGTYELRLTVSDGRCVSEPDTVLVTTENRPPIAVPGEAQAVNVGSLVQLDGSASHDPDNDTIEQYEWTMVVRPQGSGAALNDRTIADPQFTADMPGEYRLQLVVRDFEYESDPADILITTTNRRPVADPGADREVDVGDVVQLDGSGSYDPDCDEIGYRWSFASVPDNATAQFDNNTIAAPAFTADKPGTYIVQLIVSDGDMDSEPVTCVITTRNRAPVADAGPDRDVYVGSEVTLDGTGSSDPDGDQLTYYWKILEQPPGSQVTIVDGHAAIARIVPDVSGDYIIGLTVHDSDALDNATLLISAEAENPPPECMQDLGAAANYNVFVSNSFTSSYSYADGRIAAGGDVDLLCYIIGGELGSIHPAETVLLSGGNVVFDEGIVYGSIRAGGSVDGVADSVRSTMPSGATVTGHAEVPEDFTAERVRLKSLSERLAGLGATGTVNSFWGTLVLSGDEVSDIQIFDITGRQAAGSHTVFVCNIPDDATIIVNIDGEETGFDHMTMWSLALRNNRVLFNFHEAITLRFVAVEVQGSVLAPRAAINSMGGVIFGTAIARSWDGPMCFGNEPFRGTLPECE